LNSEGDDNSFDSIFVNRNSHNKRKSNEAPFPFVSQLVVATHHYTLITPYLRDMKTRQKNAQQHPGQPDAKRARRTPAEVKAATAARQLAKVNEKLKRRNDLEVSIRKTAEIERNIQRQDEENKSNRPDLRQHTSRHTSQAIEDVSDAESCGTDAEVDADSEADVPAPFESALEAPEFELGDVEDGDRDDDDDYSHGSLESDDDDSDAALEEILNASKKKVSLNAINLTGTYRQA
jgi:hypothetical protein